MLYYCLVFHYERPILGDHPKDHLAEIWQISHEIRWISIEIHLKTLKSNNSRKTLHFHAVQREDYVSWFYMKSATKDHMPGMVRPMFSCFIKSHLLRIAFTKSWMIRRRFNEWNNRQNCNLSVLNWKKWTYINSI